MLNQTDFPVGDFSGGITDYILDAPGNQHAVLNNYLIDPNRKLIQAPGSQIFDSAMYQIPSGSNRVCGLFASQSLSTLLINSARNIWYPNGVFTALTGPTGNPAFSSGAVTNFTAWAEYAEHVYATNDSLAYPIKMYIDGTSTKQLRTAGMPPLASSPTVTSSGGAGNNYIYAFVHYYTYTVGTVVFEDYGPVTYVSLNNVGAPNVNVVNITAIPTLANGGTLNYDTSAGTGVDIRIYRTTNNGTIFYQIGSVNNGTAIFNDNISDATAATGALLYTNGGVLDNDPPPQCKYVTVVNGIAYYGHVQEGSEVIKNRVRQSIQDDPDSCPEICYIDLLDEVVGLSSFNDNPLVFTKGHVYRLNGYINELGQGSITAEDITKTIGCQSHNSIVQTRFGVFWAGDDGFYWTDGFQFKKISDSINETYKILVSTQTKGSRIYGAFDKKDNRVYWALQADDSSSDNDTFFVLDLRYGINDASTFTTRNNGTSFAPTAICFYNGQLIRGDRRGYIFKHDQSYASDPKVDTLVAATLWNQKAIIVEYKSTAFNFNIPNIRKWVPKMLLTLQNQTNVSVQVYSINDNTGNEIPLYPIRYTDNVLWGDPSPIWGNSTPQWNYYNLIEQILRFPARGLRCSYKAIKITNAYTIIYNSDSTSTADVDNVLKTATLTNVLISWPTDVVDYYISFASDNYTQDYLITSINSATEITYQDTGNTSPNALGEKWVIRGFPKNQILNILSYVIYFAPLTDQTYKTYRSEQDPSGGNV